jgi:uncharacterized protein YqjF (DUF2071 family)
MISRLLIRTRPPGWPVMYQTWDTRLFLHWPVAAERLRPMIAPRLSLETFEGQAWVSVTPITMRGIRPVLLPWGRLSRVRIVHRPWPLRHVERLSFTSTMLESQGLPTPPEDPRLHAQGEPLRVGIWPPERL